MVFLRLLSSRAWQKFTYYCQNSVAWYNSEAANYRDAINLLGDNEEEIRTKKLSADDVDDKCLVCGLAI